MTKKNKFYILSFIVVFGCFLLTFNVLALSNPVTTLGNDATIAGLVNRLITWFLSLVGVIMLVLFVYAGLLWMTSQGGDQIKKAKDTMKWALLGLVVVFGAYAIVFSVINMFF